MLPLCDLLVVSIDQFYHVNKIRETKVAKLIVVILCWIVCLSISRIFK
jgi:hypothetical protein